MKTNLFFKGFLVIFLLIGLVWLRSSLEKISSGHFVNSLGAILLKAADRNPYSWYKSFLTSIAIPNSQVFGLLTMWGEFLTATAITFGSLYLLFSKIKHKVSYILLLSGLIGGMFLNVTFWLGFGYTSPSTDSLNLLMFFIELNGTVVILRYLTKTSK